MPRKAASTAASGLPTKFTTVRLVLAPGSTSSRETPSADSIAAVICRMISRSRPSEKLGTHSISFCIRVADSKSSCRPIRVEQAHNVFYQERQTFLHDSPRVEPVNTVQRFADNFEFAFHCASEKTVGRIFGKAFSSCVLKNALA